MRLRALALPTATLSLVALVACSNSVKIGGDDTGLVAGEDPEVIDADGDGVPAEDDCDDADPDVHPDAEELPDGVDNDCDGYEDELEVCAGAYADIQGAIDDALDGGLVLICAGVYAEQLDLSGRELTLIGLDGAEQTVIDAEGQGTVMTLDSRSEVSVEGLTFTGGMAESGGGVHCRGGELSMSASVIEASEAIQSGGGLYAEGCDLELSGVRLSGNAAGAYGGGLYASNTRGEVEASVIEGNIAYEGGGLFATGGDLDVVGNELRGNEATTVDEEAWGPGGGGGGLWMSTNSEVRGNVIAENHSAYHAGGAYFRQGRPVFEDNEVLDNTNGEDGAGVYFNYSTCEVRGNLIQGNVSADDGGGLRLYVGSCVVEDNVIMGNTANDDGGGAKFSHSEHVFRRNHLEDNHTGDAGGGLELDNDSTHVSDSTFIGNTAGRGGGLHNWRTERRFTIETSTFEDNEASDCGGGLYFDNNPYLVTLHELVIEGNSADDGAAICTDMVYRDPEDVGGQEDYYQVSHLRVRNVVMSDNEADDDGGAIYVKAGRVDIGFTVIADNEGADASAAVAKEDGQLIIANSILSDNSGGPALKVEDDGVIQVSYSDLWGHDELVEGADDPSGLAGNISEDPQFGINWNLDASSPCIDAADPSLSDRDGSRADMGYHGGPDAP